MLEVVAGIGDHHELGGRHHPAQPEHELGAADATGKGDNEASGRRRDRAPVHRNKSSSGGRISDSPGVAAPVQDSPRTSTAGCASSACPMMSDAALAISSAKPVSVTRNSWANRSLRPRRSLSAGSPAAPSATPTVPRRHARPQLSVMMTAGLL